MTMTREELIAEHGELHILRCEAMMARDAGDTHEYNRIVDRHNALLAEKKAKTAAT